jgi:hypothetical protein
MGRKLDRLEAARKAGTLDKHELDVQAAGGRLRQAAKAEEKAARVDSSGFIFTGNTYTLRPGEDFFSLSKRLYGSSAYFSILQKYNQGLIPKAGMSIKIPVIRNTGAVSPNTEVPAGNVTPTTSTPAGVTQSTAPASIYGAGGIQAAPNQTQGGFTLGLPALQGPQSLPRPTGIQQGGGIQFAPDMPTGSLRAPISVPSSFGISEGRATFQNPLPNPPVLSQPKPSTGGGGASETEIVKNHAVNIENTAQSTGRPPFTVSAEAAEVLGISEQLANPQSGYIFQNGSYRVDPLAQWVLNQQQQSVTDFNMGGSVPRPELIYRRRTEREKTRELAGRGIDESNYARYAPPQPYGGGYGGNAGNVISWRIPFG